MANLKDIKSRIQSVENTKKITRAMKMVAAAKVKKAESSVKAARPFSNELLSLFRKNYSAPRSFQTSGSFFQYGDRFDRMALIRICNYIIHSGILNKYPFCSYQKQRSNYENKTSFQKVEVLTSCHTSACSTGRFKTS